jgi:sugar lactone lactonase YvrE
MVSYSAFARSAVVIGPKGEIVCAGGNGLSIYEDASAVPKKLDRGIRPRTLTIDHQGRIYAVDRKTGNLLMVDPKGKSKKIDDGLPGATAIQISADQSQLFLASSGQFILSYMIEKDGAVSNRQPYFDLHLPYGETSSGATAMSTDNQGRLYVATTMGIQIMDQPGRVNGIIDSPAREPVTGLAWGGPSMDTLYAVAGGKLYARKLATKGVVSSAPPVKLPTPRL